MVKEERSGLHHAPSQWNNDAMAHDFEDDPFSHALDKVLGLDDSEVEGGDEDLVFDDLSFSDDTFGTDQAKEDKKCAREQPKGCERSRVAPAETDESIRHEPAVVAQEETTATAREEVLGLCINVTQIPVEKPKRSLSAYNFFFKAERKRLLEVLPVRTGPKPRRSHGKMGFAEMARAISTKWKNITPAEKMEYDHLSALDGERYEREMDAWKKWEVMKEVQAKASGVSAKLAATSTNPKNSTFTFTPSTSALERKTSERDLVPLAAKSSDLSIGNDIPSNLVAEMNSNKRKMDSEASSDSNKREMDCEASSDSNKRKTDSIASSDSNERKMDSEASRTPAKVSVQLERPKKSSKLATSTKSPEASSKIGREENTQDKEKRSATSSKQRGIPKAPTIKKSKKGPNSKPMPSQKSVTARSLNKAKSESVVELVSVTRTKTPSETQLHSPKAAKSPPTTQEDIPKPSVQNKLENSEEVQDVPRKPPTSQPKTELLKDEISKEGKSPEENSTMEPSKGYLHTATIKKKDDEKATAATKVSEDSSESTEDSDDEDNIDSVLGKLDFDLLTFAEMLQDTSFALAGVRVVEDSDDETDDNSEEDKKTAAKPVPQTDDSSKELSKTAISASKDTEKPERKSSKVNDGAKKDTKKRASGNGSVARPAVSKDQVRPNPVMSMNELKKLTGIDTKKKIIRCLSAYNIFFKAERQKLLETLPDRSGKKPRRSHGKMGFADLARTIAAKWKSISAEEKMHYEHLSALDAERYEQEKKEQAAAVATATVSDDDSSSSKRLGKEAKGSQSQDIIDLSADDSDVDSTPVTSSRMGPEPVTLMMRQQYVPPLPFFFTPHQMGMMHAGPMGYPGFVTPMPFAGMYGPTAHLAISQLAPPQPMTGGGSDGGPETVSSGGSTVSMFLRKSLCKR